MPKKGFKHTRETKTKISLARARQVIGEVKMKPSLFLISFIFLVTFSYIPSIIADVEIKIPESSSLTIFQGNLTNLSELEDVSIPSPGDNEVLTFDSGTNKWNSESAAAVGDTNETIRFDALVGNCSAGDFILGVFASGDRVCGTPPASSNIFDQVLNTTSNVTFSMINITNFIGTDLIPLKDSTFSIGSLTKRWLTAFFDTLVVTDINASIIRSDDWTNVSITESQITDLQTYLLQSNRTLAGNFSATTDFCIVGGNCISGLGAGAEPLFLDNWTLYNSTAWTTTNAEIWGLVDNSTFALITEPLWTDNFTKFNTTWSSGISWDKVVNGTTLLANNKTLAGNYSATEDFCIAGGSCLSGAGTDTDTHANTSGIYLFNDTNTHFFNVTLAGTNLSVNSSDFWDGLNTPLASWTNITNFSYDLAFKFTTNDTFYLDSNPDGFVSNITMNKSVSCNDIVGSPDSDFCTDATGAAGGITGAGTSGFIARFNGTEEINDSTIYQNNTFVGVNTTNPSTLFHVVGNITGSWFIGILDWSNIVNAFISSVSGNYLSVTAGDLTFDEDLLNTTIGTFNITQTAYTDAQDVNFNTTMTTYVDAKDTSFNTSLKDYSDATFLDVSGDTITGNITLGSNCLINQTGGAFFCHNGTGWLIKG